MPQVALLTIHGMGENSYDYAENLFRHLRPRLAGAMARVEFRAVYYHDILRPNQELVWTRLHNGSPLRYDELRRFLLFGIGDAAGLENRKEVDGSVYELAQGAIALQLLGVHQRDPDSAVVFLAQSLGGQVLSSYLYDAQKAAAGVPVAGGIWKDIDAWATRVLRRLLSDDEKRFLAGGSCTALLTTGCNIPIFCAAHREMDIRPIERPTPGFQWINIYDPDDALGWPLQPLSPGYAALVDDRPINAGQGVVAMMLKGWNPLSHTLYWDDRHVLDTLAGLLHAQVG